MSIKFVPNKDGKIVLLDQQGNRTYFDHGVDANEALNLLDAKGEHRYTLPSPKVQKTAKIPPAQDIDEDDIVTSGEVKQKRTKQQKAKDIEDDSEPTED